MMYVRLNKPNKTFGGVKMKREELELMLASMSEEDCEKVYDELDERLANEKDAFYPEYIEMATLLDERLYELAHDDVEEQMLKDLGFIIKSYGNMSKTHAVEIGKYRFGFGAILLIDGKEFMYQGKLPESIK